jgi:diguanylate cyclase (GGDEF)-like protein
LSQSLDMWDANQRLQRETARQQARADHDALTGLENRSAFLTRLPATLEHAQQNQTLLAVGIIDLDDFKPINDTYGHTAGDQFLRNWSQRLFTWFHESHGVARLGGDEFLFYLSGFPDLNALEDWLTACLVDMTAPTRVILPSSLPVDITVQASLGLTIAPWDTADPDGLLRHADLALYRSKDRKSSRPHPWAWYQATPTQKSRFHAAIPRDLRVHYQPIVDVYSGQVHSLEALVRLQNGSQLLPPVQFLSQLTAAEMEDLTFGVLDHVLQDVQHLDVHWHTPAPLSIAINLEPSMLSPSCIAHISQRVQQSAMAPERLTLELLETSDFLSRGLARHQLQVLKEKRFQLALDDVGSAYSSLLRIKELPIDTFKLDQAFVRHIPEHPDDLLFVISIQTLARGLHAHFVAEGVETAEILDALQVLGVDRVQGYVFTPPLSLPDLLNWSQSFHPQVADGRPHSLLGAYAAHLAYQFLDRVMPTSAEARQRTAICPLTRYLTAHGGKWSALAAEHIRYHREWSVVDPQVILGDRLKHLLVEAMADPDATILTLSNEGR